MTKKTKLTVLILAAVLLALGGAVAVFAYFTSMNNKDNTMTIARNTIQVSEQFEPLTQQEIGENIYQKEISINNTGNAPCYIRVYADFSDDDIRSRSSLTNGSDKDTAAYYSARRTIDPDDGITTFPEFINSQGTWVFVPEDDASPLSGYYYYPEPVPAGQSTLPLFTYVKTNNPTAGDIQQYDIVVYSESVQVTGQDGKAFEDYRSAWLEYLNRLG